MFLDESGANTQMTRRCGRSPIGQRLVCCVPHGHYKTTTLVAALRLSGPQAPWLFDGPMDGELILAWVKTGLVPTLHPRDVVVMDNLATHKVAGVKEAIEGAGARIEYLPPYSPDLNPIERLWLRRKADWFWDFIARTPDELTDRLCTALKSFIDDPAKTVPICSIRK